jgi:hypothetical protein
MSTSKSGGSLKTTQDGLRQNNLWAEKLVSSGGLLLRGISLASASLVFRSLFWMKVPRILTELKPSGNVTSLQIFAVLKKDRGKRRGTEIEEIPIREFEGTDGGERNPEINEEKIPRVRKALHQDSASGLKMAEILALPEHAFQQWQSGFIEEHVILKDHDPLVVVLVRVPPEPHVRPETPQLASLDQLQNP